MSNKITPKWIIANKQKILDIKLSNGIGPQKGRFGRLYKWFLRTILHREKSFYFDAGVIHDVLYIVGGDINDKKMADSRFLQYMFITLNSKSKWWNIGRYIKYGLLAITYYLIVSYFGKKFFSFRDKPLTKIEVNFILNVTE